ncbi:hypothetical protein Q9L58_007570 [Maublancomyces gigas]|uniref:Uncharacterized protein n=1 Tax=Discina gigas TaxID=1032678 RepID=A0ABR3GC50_9PEZI
MAKSGLKKNNSSATMATSTDSSTLAPSVVGDLSEKIGAGVDAEVDDEPATSESSQTGDDVEDTSGYPKPLALGLITMALCLAVFLVALVSFFLSHVPATGNLVFSMGFGSLTVLCDRTKQLSPRQFLKSPINSTRWKMLVGMDLVTC